MKAKDYVRLTKLKEANNPIAPTPNKKDYVPGTDNGFVSLPIDYTVEGYLLADVKVGDIIQVDRRKRNGVEMLGFMSTSSITKINKDTIETRNSIYKIEKLS